MSQEAKSRKLRDDISNFKDSAERGNRKWGRV